MPRMRFAPDPAGGAHDAPPDPLVGWGGKHVPPRTSPPRRLQHLDPRLFDARCSGNRAANGLRWALGASIQGRLIEGTESLNGV